MGFFGVILFTFFPRKVPLWKKTDNGYEEKIKSN